MSETTSLFPAPVVPAPALAQLQLSATFARLAQTSLTSALTTAAALKAAPEALAHLGNLVKCARETHEAAEALIKASKS